MEKRQLNQVQVSRRYFEEKGTHSAMNNIGVADGVRRLLKKSVAKCEILGRIC